MTIDLLRTALTWTALALMAAAFAATLAALLVSRAANPVARLWAISAWLAGAGWLILVVVVPVAIALLEGVAP